MNTNTEEMKKVMKWGWIVLVVLAVFLGVQTLGALGDLSETSPSFHSISVNGEGEVVAIPDTATFSFSIEASAPTPSEAQSQVTDKMNVIIDKLAEMDIEDEDVKTTSYSVYPKYTYERVPCTINYCPPQTQKQDGYTAHHSVSVKVRESGNAGVVLAGVGDLGATNISGISFTIDDEDELIEEARLQAIKDARAKAKVLAKELGVRIVGVVNYYDNSGGYPMPFYSEAAYGGDSMTRSVSVPKIPQGENTYSANVTVVYEIR